MKKNQHSKHIITLSLILAGIISLPAFSWANDARAAGAAQLQKTLAAHGGLATWQGYGSLNYTMQGFPLSEQIAKPNRSFVDLKSRTNRIEGEGFVVGFDGQNSWSTPAPKASGLPSRFVSLGSFYFVGIPFVLADPGVNVSWDGSKSFQGKTCHVLDVSFSNGVGHSAEDNYQIYIDPATDRVALINHNVTELYDEKTRVTWVYNDYAAVGSDGLVLPRSLTFYQGWNENPAADSGATYQVLDYQVAADRQQPSLYQAPADASINDQ